MGAPPAAPVAGFAQRFAARYAFNGVQTGSTRSFRDNVFWTARGWVAEGQPSGAANVEASGNRGVDPGSAELVVPNNDYAWGESTGITVSEDSMSMLRRRRQLSPPAMSWRWSWWRRRPCRVAAAIAAVPSCPELPIE